MKKCFNFSPSNITTAYLAYMFFMMFLKQLLCEKDQFQKHYCVQKNLVDWSK